MPVQERLGRLPWVALHKAGIRLRQIHAEKVDLLAHASNNRDGLAEVHLRVTWGMA
jgi:hypothetical protein